MTVCVDVCACDCVCACVCVCVSLSLCSVLITDGITRTQVRFVAVCTSLLIFDITHARAAPLCVVVAVYTIWILCLIAVSMCGCGRLNLAARYIMGVTMASVIIVIAGYLANGEYAVCVHVHIHHAGGDL